MESCLASKTNDSCSGWEARDTSLPRGSPWRKNIVAKKRCQLSCQENRTKKKTWDRHEQSNPRSSCQKVVPETQFGLHTFYSLKIKCILDDTGACQKVVPETQFGLHTFYILKIKCILDDTRVSSSTLPWCPGKRVCQSLVLHHVTNLTNYKIQILIKFYKLYGQQLQKLLCQHSYGSRVQTCDRLKGRVILSNGRIAIQRISVNKTHCDIHRIEI